MLGSADAFSSECRQQALRSGCGVTTRGRAPTEGEVGRIQNGNFTDVEVPRGQLTINGDVNGIAIAEGASLTINGQVRGSIAIGEGGVLLANGLFNPSHVDNAGVISVAGMVLVSPMDTAGLGMFAVSPGSLLGDRLVLMRDGTLVDISEAGESLTVQGDERCVWFEDERRWLPVDRAERRAAERGAAEHED